MKRLIWLPIAGFLLIAGAAVAAAAPTITAVSESALATLNDGDEGDERAAGEFHVRFGGGVDLLEQVLADLVAAGTITQDQSDAITDALAAEVQAQRAAIEAEMQLWQGFIEDGVITQDEVNQLPEDSPFREVFNSIAQDGQVDVDQLREFGPGLRHGGGPGHGHGWRIDGPDPDTDTDPDSSTDANPDSESDS